MDIKTAGRTLDLFEAFAADPRPLRLKEIAAALQAPVSSCFQLLRTLENRGYLYGLQLKSYYPTRRMLQNAERISAQDPLLRLVTPHMEALRDETGESVLVAQLSGTKALLLEVVESPESIRYSAAAGSVRNLHCSGVGKCLLGSMAPEERARSLPGSTYPRLTAETLTTKRQLETALAASAKRGWYASHGETSLDLWSVAAPLQLQGMRLALSIAGPASRFAEKEKRHAKALVAATRRIEQSLQGLG